METLKLALATLGIVGIVYMSLENKAHGAVLHHEVQVVTGGQVDAEAFAETVWNQITVCVGGPMTIYVLVTPHTGATTVAVTIIAARISRRNEGRVRIAIEAALRRPGVVRNGYSAIPQRASAARMVSPL